MSTTRAALFSRLMPAILLIAAAVLLDQTIKLAVEAWLPFQGEVAVMPSLSLYRTYNYGVAFSMMAGTGGWFIVGLRLVVIGFVLWLWRRTPGDRFLPHLGFALIVAGALGNLIDGLLLGYVIDYVLFYVGNWSFAVFNLADTFITLGAGAIILEELLVANKAGR